MHARGDSDNVLVVGTGPAGLEAGLALALRGYDVAFAERGTEWSDADIRSIKVIGHAEAPGPIAWATYAGHRFARELDMPDMGNQLPFKREITQLHLETS